VKKNGKEALVL